MNGLEAVTAERREQEATHGWDQNHDATHVKGELLRAAQCYITLALHQDNGPAAIVKKMMAEVPKGWPWDPMDWHPSQIAKNNLKKAGALVVAEWDRLDRAGL